MLILFPAGNSFAAQNPAPVPPQQPSQAPPVELKVRSELVNVDVTVTDAHGNFVADLHRKNFRVLDDGVEQTLTKFIPVDAPAEVVMLVETSPAVYMIHRQHLEAAYALLDGLAPDDSVALATYDQTLRLGLPFTQDKAALSHALLGLHYNLGMGELNLYDALATALDWLAPVPGKKTIVLLSTGLDSSSPDHWDSLVQKLRASDVTIYPIALGEKLREFKGQADETGEGAAELSFQKANQALNALARISGGRAYFPRAAKDFVKIYRELAVALRHQYSLGFAPPAHDGRYHTLEVQVLDAHGRLLAQAPAGAKSRWRVAARQGYLAPAPGN